MLDVVLNWSAIVVKVRAVQVKSPVEIPGGDEEGWWIRKAESRLTKLETTKPSVGGDFPWPKGGLAATGTLRELRMHIRRGPNSLSSP